MKNGQSILRLHSPFVYDLAVSVLRDRKNYYAFSTIEGLRKQLLKEGRAIEMQDFGAGSHRTGKTARSISSITRSSAIPRKYGKMLFRLVEKFKPANILEMGTCVGIGTLYLSAPETHEKVITLEGDPTLASIAAHHLENYPLATLGVEVITGEFSATLPGALEQLGKIDLAFIDGNHRKQPTLDYFEAILPYCHENSILIFDDIHWSPEMVDAWEAIKAHPDVVITIDLFRLGLVFFRKEHKEKEHFMLWF